MKTQILTVGLFALIASDALTAEPQPPAIIPQPRNFELREGVFRLGKQTKIFADPASRETGQYLSTQLRHSTGTELPVVREGKTDGGNIVLKVDNGSSQLGQEGYSLVVMPEGIALRAADPTGLFYGVQTLLQLVPAMVNGARERGAEVLIQCVKIEDRPRFKWRGLMLDVSRHFFSKDEVKKVLDGMAAYKLNRFHWHLADDQGWRIEIKKYPRLTEVGAWRKSIGFGLDAKSSSAYGADGRYGGYYTQADIREVVEYAQARHITIVPEIEMPGHASAALMAYPQYSCTGGPFTTDLPGGVFDGIYCAGNDESFKFLEGVLSEVFDLFPGRYVHIGGDEVLTNSWHNCVKCQARLSREGLKKDMDLEGYFIRRMEKFINAHHRDLIGWSEIREGGLAQNATVMDWVGGAVEATTAGHDVVMSPLADCYFDHYQSKDHSTEPHAIGGYLPIQQVYAFEPLPKGLAPEYEGHILGAQANVWTEYMPSIKHVEYMIFPRLCALAEVVWSPKERRNYDDFNGRLQGHYARLEAMGLNYRHPSGMPAGTGGSQ